MRPILIITTHPIHGAIRERERPTPSWSRQWRWRQKQRQWPVRPTDCVAHRRPGRARPATRRLRAGRGYGRASVSGHGATCGAPRWKPSGAAAAGHRRVGPATSLILRDPSCARRLALMDISIQKNKLHFIKYSLNEYNVYNNKNKNNNSNNNNNVSQWRHPTLDTCADSTVALVASLPSQISCDVQ